MRIRPAVSVCVPLAMLLFSYAFACRAPGEYTTPQECPFERSLAVNAATAEAGSLTHGIQPGYRLAVSRAQDAAFEVRLDSAQALSRQDELADCDQRQSFAIDDRLEVAGADAIATILADIDDA